MNLSKTWVAQLDDYVIDLAWSPDGRTLALASAAGPVTLFDAAGARLHTLPGHADGTNAVAFAPAVIPESGDRQPEGRSWRAAVRMGPCGFGTACPEHRPQKRLSAMRGSNISRGGR